MSELKYSDHVRKKKRMIEATIHEAERFIGRAREAANACTPDLEGTFGGQKMAAAKRASMDLTKALAALRKPYQ